VLLTFGQTRNIRQGTKWMEGEGGKKGKEGEVRKEREGGKKGKKVR
jgi:hypothetical protein